VNASWYIYILACWSSLAFSWDYYRILKKSRITCVDLIDLCLGVDPAWLQIAYFLCMCYLYEISNRCLVFQSHILNILYEHMHLMHVCGILFGLNRIVCVTMYISIVVWTLFLFLKYAPLLKSDVVLKLRYPFIGFWNFIYLVIWSFVLVALLVF
jgi:hypothetical protein